MQRETDHVINMLISEPESKCTRRRRHAVHDPPGLYLHTQTPKECLQSSDIVLPACLVQVTSGDSTGASASAVSCV